MDNQTTPRWSRGSIALVAVTSVIGLTLVGVAAAFAGRTLSQDDCITVTTALSDGGSRSVRTCT